MVTICCLLFFCEFFNFAFNFAMLRHWATAYLFVPQIVTPLVCTVFFWTSNFLSMFSVSLNIRNSLSSQGSLPSSLGKNLNKNLRSLSSVVNACLSWHEHFVSFKYLCFSIPVRRCSM